mmetsp:Transcript_44543/g.74070  ORF Transcript_44543/g.74070 Transcript_44543/m.74070 type:complete len:137 (-) Transcript_44543:56-466(-)
MVFYESTFLLHGKFSPHDTRLLLREAMRSVVDRDGRVLRLLDLGWRHTAQPAKKRGKVGVYFYGRWYAMTWGGPPKAVRELEATFQHSTGILRHRHEKIRHPFDMYIPRRTFYPTLDPASGESPAPPLAHHTGPAE